MTVVEPRGHIAEALKVRNKAIIEHKNNSNICNIYFRQEGNTQIRHLYVYSRYFSRQTF